MLAERDDDFRMLRDLVVTTDENTGEAFWSLEALCRTLGVTDQRAIDDALARAKITASRANWPLKEHFQSGNMFVPAGDIVISKYAAYLFVMNCNPEQGNVGLAQAYFALQVDRQRLEDERRLKTRLDVANENVKLNGAAKEAGVQDFAKFNGRGIQGLYGELTVPKLLVRKGIPENGILLDYAGSEELAANLFRITQTRAALARQGVRSESVACSTHYTVAKSIRDTIKRAGNTLPEDLPAAEFKIDQLASKTAKVMSDQRHQLGT